MDNKIFESISSNGENYHYARWRKGTLPLMLVHGITSSHMAWARVVKALGEGHDIFAPDLRGRGKNYLLGPPYGFAAHIDDLLRLMDHHRIDKIPYVGHSLGAYIGLDLAHRAPDRISALVLVDGGIALPLPEGKTPDEIIKAILGPALARLDQRFADKPAYHKFWQDHPAFQDPDAWNAEVQALVEYELVGEPPGLQAGIDAEAIRIDSYGPMEPSMVNRIDEVQCPTLLLTAPRGLLNQEKPLLPVHAVAEKNRSIDMLEVVEIADTNHYSIVLGSGAQPLAKHIEEFLRRHLN